MAAAAAWHTLNVQWAITVVKLQLPRASQNAAQTVSTTLHWALLSKCYYFILFSLCKVVELFSEKCLQFFRELLLRWVDVEVICRTPALCAGWKFWRLVYSASSTFTEYSSVIMPVITLEIVFHQCLFCTYILAVSNTRIPTKKMMKGTPFLHYPFL